MISLFIPLSGFMDSIYGLLSAMMQPLYWAVSGLVVLFHTFWGNLFGAESGLSWTLAIICLTIIIRTLLIPLFVKQIHSARSMQLLAPKTKELQAKYGHDRQRLSEETMRLYREEGVNPMASCLPMLIQGPILLALLRVLDGASRNHVRGYWFNAHPELVSSLQHAKLFGVSMADTFLPITPFGARQIFTGILVILMVAVLFITQLQLMRKNMPAEALTGPAAKQQKMMLYCMPGLFLTSSVMFPVGVLVYWLTSNIWTMGQQYILIHNNPAPNTPAYIDWQERMKAKGKDPHELERIRLEKKRRSVKMTPSRTVAGASESAQSPTAETQVETNQTATVARQKVVRQTVRRRMAEGSEQVLRSQPSRSTRAVRRRKK